METSHLSTPPPDPAKKITNETDTAAAEAIKQTVNAPVSATSYYSPFKEGKLIPSFQTLKIAWSAYQQNWKKFVGLLLLLYAVVIGALIILTLVVGASTLFSRSLVGTSPTGATAALTGANIIIIIISMLLIGVSSVLFQFSIITLATKLEPQTGISEAIKITWGKFLSLLWISFLSTIIIAIGYLLLIIPGIILALYFAFALYVCLTEDKKGWAALKRSKEIVQGYTFALLRRYLLWLYLAVLVMFVSSIPILGQIFTLVSPFIITPLFTIYLIAIYFNFRDLKAKGQKSDNFTVKDKLVTLLLIIIPVILLGLITAFSIGAQLKSNSAKHEARQKDNYSMPEKTLLIAFDFLL